MANSNEYIRQGSASDEESGKDVNVVVDPSLQMQIDLEKEKQKTIKLEHEEKRRTEATRRKHKMDEIKAESQLVEKKIRLETGGKRIPARTEDTSEHYNDSRFGVAAATSLKVGAKSPSAGAPRKQAAKTTPRTPAKTPSNNTFGYTTFCQVRLKTYNPKPKWEDIKCYVQLKKEVPQITKVGVLA